MVRGEGKFRDFRLGSKRIFRLKNHNFQNSKIQNNALNFF